MSKTIMVCNKHWKPLIWTFAFPYAEYFCMAGNHAGGMFGTGKEVELTPELKKLQTLYNRRWGQNRQYIALGRYKRTDCNKCDASNEYHTQHLTDKEIRLHEMAMKRLKKYAKEQR